jgi:hypothetical protein
MYDKSDGQDSYFFFSKEENSNSPVDHKDGVTR